ncbi:hypothetical protein JKF63_06335 [Porcisia hertigi]|uniref:Uncharacterized protein n=1 Tax=Porcisia hertigi TaxID=2761500 RepID=A0A836LH68_9TRYP|nr:hypothetical protein JKF63_06335 [Porcisia hertigi]
MSVPNFTAEELAYYASLNLDDPDEATLEAFLAETEQVPEYHTSDTDTTSSNTAASAVEDGEALATSRDKPPREHFICSGVGKVAPERGTAPFDHRLSTSASTVLAKRRLSAGLPPVPVSSTTGSSTRYGFTQVLEKEKLVGGVEGIADAALQTRCVELPAKQLTSTAPIQCFLNATHVYLQHNTLTDLAGVELLSQLQVLVVHHNQLTSLAPLQQLDRLFYLDVSHNSVSSSVDALLRDELPCASLKSLNLSHNPCWTQCGEGAVNGAEERHRAYVQLVCTACPLLERLDDVEVEDGEEVVVPHSGSSTESEASSALEQPPATVADTSPSKARGIAVRRVHHALETARSARTPPGVPHRHTRSSPEPSSCISSGVAGPSLQPHSSDEVEELTLLDEEETRLVHQLILRRAVDGALESPKGVETPSTDDPLHLSRNCAGSAHPHASAPVTEAAAERRTGELTEITADESALLGTRSNTLQLYRNLQFTQAVSQARLQRDMLAYWDDVSRVLQTAQALQQDRRRRLQQRLQGQTPEYMDSLALLQKESYVKDLDRYRSSDWIKKHASAGNDAAASVSVAPPSVAAPSVGAAVAKKITDVGGNSTPAASSASKRAPGKAPKKTPMDVSAPKRVPKPPAPR